MEKHRVTAANAERIAQWLRERGGLAIWDSINLSNPGASWTTPRLQADGTATPKPTWQVGNEPVRLITDPAEVEVVVPKEVKRFRVAVRAGAQGLALKLTDASSTRLRRVLGRFGEQAWYEFDYATQEAIIFMPGETVPLAEWEARQAAA